MHVFLETERLVLRRFTEADVGNLVTLDRDPEVLRYINGGIPTPTDVIQHEIVPRFLRYYDRYEGYGFWAAVEKTSNEFLGWFCLHPEAEDEDRFPLGRQSAGIAAGVGQGAAFREVDEVCVAAFTVVKSRQSGWFRTISTPPAHSSGQVTSGLSI